MITTTIFNLIKNLLFTVFQFINLPNFPEEITGTVNDFLDLIFNNVNFLGFFIPGELIINTFTWVLIIMNFEHIYHFVLWLIKKIPVANIK